MTKPRYMPEGYTFETTRRCILRQMRLTPSKLVNQVLLYLLAYYANEREVRVHAYTFMSNHYHKMLTPTQDNLSLFLQDFNSIAARAINSMHGDWESMWTNGSFDAVALLDIGAVTQKLVYMAVNPVKAGMVSSHKEWPGLISSPSDWGKTITVKRPKIKFFKHSKDYPESVKLTLTMPPALKHLEEKQLVGALLASIHNKEKAIKRARKAEGKRFWGAHNILKQNRYDPPTTKAPRRKLRPTLSCKNKKERIDAKAALILFYRAYKEAINAYLGGDKEVVFPYGTYLMRVRFGVNVYDSS